MKKNKERKILGILKNPYQCNKKDSVYKIMVHQTARSGVFIYFFTSLEAEFSSFDASPNQSFEECIKDWDEEVKEWIEIPIN